MTDAETRLPDLVRDLCKKVLTHIEELTEHLAELGIKIAAVSHRRMGSVTCAGC